MSTVELGSVQGPALLRLFDAEQVASLPDEPSDRLSADASLSEFWDRYVLPVVAQSCDWSKGTLASYGEGVGYWSALTSNLPLRRIDAFETASFVAGMRLQPGRAEGFMSTANIRKHCATVQRVLLIAGPRQRRSKKDLRRFGAGLIADVPWIEAPEPDEMLPDGDFTHEEVLAILAACKLMTRPCWRGVPPGVWWDALVRFLCATGLRIGTAMALEWSMVQGEMLVIPGAITKKRRPHVQYLHPAITAAIEPLRGVSTRLFPFANYPQPGGVRTLQRHREKLVTLAGLPEDRRFGFHGFRKYHATELFQAVGLDGAAASLNHRDGATTLGHYVNHRAQADARVRLQRDSIDQMRLLRDA